MGSVDPVPGMAGISSSNKKPIFCATHPRACSTAFERVFMTRRDVLSCFHEPFGDAFYYGPERLSARYDQDEREKTGFANTTYADVLKSFEDATEEGTKRLFVKDMIYYLFPPNRQPAQLAPSVANGVKTGHTNGNGVATPKDNPSNPTVLPMDILRQFQFTFLIRHPRRAIPSYFRCTVPPLDDVTGWYEFDPLEAGYDELRRFFDLSRREGLLEQPENLVVIDADDLLDDPEGILRAYCDRVGLDFCDNMLNWSEEDTAFAQEKFAKWEGFHDDALKSSNLRPRTHAHKSVNKETEDREWAEKYGEEAAKTIRKTVDDNVADYEYLKKFAIRV